MKELILTIIMLLLVISSGCASKRSKEEVLQEIAQTKESIAREEKGRSFDVNMACIGKYALDSEDCKKAKFEAEQKSKKKVETYESIIRTLQREIDELEKQ